MQTLNTTSTYLVPMGDRLYKEISGEDIARLLLKKANKGYTKSDIAKVKKSLGLLRYAVEHGKYTNQTKTTAKGIDTMYKKIKANIAKLDHTNKDELDGQLEDLMLDYLSLTEMT